MEIIDSTSDAVLLARDTEIARRNLSREFFLSVMNGNALRAREISTDSYRKSVLAPNNETTDADGGYIVPEEFSTYIDTDLRKTSLAFQECGIIPMQRETLNISTLTATPTVAWYTENGAISASKGTFGRLTLNAQKIAAIVPASYELLADANIDYPNLMAVGVNDAFVQEIDAQVFRGTGSPITGILGTTGITKKYLAGSSTGGKKKYSDITWDDIYTLVTTALPTRNMRGAKVFLDQNVVAVLMKTKASGSGEYFMPTLGINTAPSPEDASATIGTFMGFPVVMVTSGVLIATYDTSDHVSTPFCIFGNLKTSCFIGNRLALAVDISRDATVESVSAFANDLSLWRFKKRLDFGIGIPSKVAVLSTDAS